MDWLTKELSGYSKSRMYSFHTPGHKGRKDLLAPIIFPDFDLTELPELDMLHNPQGVIGKTQKKAAEAYGAEETFFLVNGATAGNQAMFLALTGGMKGKKVRIERKAHRSVISALILSGLTPEYIPAVIHPDFNLPLGLNHDTYLADPKEVGAFHLTDPSYYGTAGDMSEVIAYRDRELPNIPILVDQAHGAHYKGDLFPQGAVAQGADLVLHSTHKTMAALTQAGMLHIQGKRINRADLRRSLEILQTSSPSYLLMASLENAINYLEKNHPWEELHEEVIQLHQKLEGPLRILTAKDAGIYGIKEIDWSKILVNVASLGIPASEAVGFLRTSFRIEPELWDDANILFLLGIGNKPEEVRVLCEALESLVKNYPPKANIQNVRTLNSSEKKATIKTLPPICLTPRETWFAPKRVIPVKDSLGKIAGETISIYPPGIPLVAAGEEITPEVQEYLVRAKEYNWQGWQGFERGEVLVVDV